MPMTGRCQCGAVAYAVDGPPLDLYVCHCLECRRQSASAFGISVIVRAADFSLTRGSVQRWTRPTDRGGTLDCAFCAACGSRLFHAAPGGQDISVKGGSLDAPPDLGKAKHIWVSRKLPGVLIPAGAEQFPGEPE